MEQESHPAVRQGGSDIFLAGDLRSYTEIGAIPQRIILAHWLREPELAVLS